MIWPQLLFIHLLSRANRERPDAGLFAAFLCGIHIDCALFNIQSKQPSHWFDGEQPSYFADSTEGLGNRSYLKRRKS
jgi:hypothetical protein